MRACAKAVCLAASWACVVSCTTQPHAHLRRAPTVPAGRPDTVCAQARPVHDWFRAVKALDVDALQRVFSVRLRDEFAKEGWDEVLSRYAAVWAEQLGPYELVHLTYTYLGDAHAGTVRTTFRGKPLPPVPVVREGDAWKVNQR